MCKGDKENKANKTVHRVAKRWGEHKFTKITSFQKGNKKKERKKHTNLEDPNSLQFAIRKPTHRKP